MSSIAVIVLMLGLIVPSAPASADVIGAFVLRARHSDMCLEVASSSTANGAPIQQAPCTNAPNQLWNMNRPCGANCYVQWINLNSGKCLELLTTPTRVNGSWMMQWDCDFANSTTQRYQVLKIGNLGTKDLYNIRVICCPVLYLNVEGGSLSSGARAAVNSSSVASSFHAQFTLA